MATFKDTSGREWRVEFDGLLLDDVLTETGLDLSDLSCGALAQLDHHASSLVKVLRVLCGDEIRERNLQPREFARALRGDALVEALEAVLGAARDFFPPSVWSAMESRLKSQREFNRQWREIRPMLAKLNEPEVPPALQQAVMEALVEMMELGDSQSLRDAMSAGGRAGIPPTSASSSPENAESPPGA